MYVDLIYLHIYLSHLPHLEVERSDFDYARLRLLDHRIVDDKLSREEVRSELKIPAFPSPRTKFDLFGVMTTRSYDRSSFAR
jgi:hypothetical protein